jgi:hypothetical protein
LPWVKGRSLATYIAADSQTSPLKKKSQSPTGMNVTQPAEVKFSVDRTWEIWGQFHRMRKLPHCHVRYRAYINKL